MKILNALGFGLLIVIFKFLTPKLFSGLENTLLVFFETIQNVLALSKHSMSAGIIIPTIPAP